MKEHPILFSTPMVEAILADRKIMTRRIPSCRNTFVDGRFVSAKAWKEFDFDLAHAWIDPGPSPAGNPGPYLKAESQTFGTIHRLYSIYLPEDIIWVREKWMKNDIPMGWPYHYYAANDTFNRPDDEKWKPSLFMPRLAARILLQVEAMTVPERLGEISQSDAIAEGIERSSDASGYTWYKNYLWESGNSLMTANFKQAPIMSFCSLWNSLNGEGSWAQNPWVWKIQFKKVE